MIRAAWALAFGLAAVSGAAAQPKRAELVLSPSAVGPDLVRALSRAVHPLPSKLVVAADPACPDRPTEPSTVLVTLHARGGGMYRLCLVSTDQRTLRELGPFATLDAAAREQISTIVEATVEALLPADAEDSAGHGDPAPRFLLSAGYAPSLLAYSHFAHGVSAELGLELSPVLLVSLQLAHTFPTAIARADAAVTANALAARAAIAGVLPVSTSIAVVGLFGATVERLSVRAGAPSTAELRRPSPRAPIDPWLTASIGLRLAVAPTFWLSARVGAALAFQRREFGFERGDRFVRVFDSGPARFHLELHAGCFL